MFQVYFLICFGVHVCVCVEGVKSSHLSCDDPLSVKLQVHLVIVGSYSVVVFFYC